MPLDNLFIEQLLDAKGQYPWYQKSRIQVFLCNAQPASWYRSHCHMPIEPNTSYIMYISSEGMNTWHLRHSHIGFFNPYHLANFLNWWDEGTCYHHSHKNIIIVEMCSSSFFGSVLKPVFKIFPNKSILQKFWIFVKKRISQWKAHFPNIFSLFNSRTAKTLSKGQSPTEALWIKS